MNRGGITNKWDFMWLKTFHKMLVGFSIAFLPACATQLLPIGDWGRPADLGLNSHSLKNLKVAVRCAEVDQDGRILPRELRICHNLSMHLVNLGAEISEHPDFVLWYVEQGTSSTQTSGISALAFALSVGIFPMVSSRTIQAELRVADGRNVVLEVVPLKLEDILTVGWGSLLAFDLKSETEQMQDIGKKLFLTAENRLASFALKSLRSARNGSEP